MSISVDSVKVKSFGEVFPKKGSNTRTLYEHQKRAMECLDIMNKNQSYSTLVVLPTGGGKTYTASMWLLKNALDKKKKILWIAHRHMLLDQAAESFQKFAYAEITPHIASFYFRVVSGASTHDRTNDINNNDQLLIVSKDSIGRNISCLDSWLKNEEEVYLIIDEAHHSTARTYRRVIDYVKNQVKNVKLIGLTATPFRTAANEQGLLAKIYSDGIKDGKAVKGDIGIAYQISLKELINRRILAKPVFESYYTSENYSDDIGIDALNSIQYLDVIPDNIAKKMSESALRNKLIVETYKANRKEYEQTIVFAVDIPHAIVLSKLFNDAGVNADYIVSDIKNSITGVTISSKENIKKINDYAEGRLQVLINVNILTEGIDLPKTKTVFLARPTVSTIVMTQMVGRALRGPAAGGTETANIVSFIDRWDERIAWVNPESLFEGNNEFSDAVADRIHRDIVTIAISKIEEFASILDESVDTSKLEQIPFMQRVPIGMYAFTYLEENGMDHSYQVMVYNSTAQAYSEFMAALPELFNAFEAKDEYLPEELLSEMETQCKDTFFCGEMFPPYSSKDIRNILKYYAQYETAPKFYTFDEIDKNKLDVAAIAQYLWDEGLGGKKRKEYVDSIWDNNDDNILRLFFRHKLYFITQLDIEYNKIAHPDIYDSIEDNVKYGMRALEDLPLYEIREINPELEKKLRDEAFGKSKNEYGEYLCAVCGRKGRSRVYFHVDHIVPMNKGGKSVGENLQILCRSCNSKKSDK